LERCIPGIAHLWMGIGLPVYRSNRYQTHSRLDKQVQSRAGIYTKKSLLVGNQQGGKGETPVLQYSTVLRLYSTRTPLVLHWYSTRTPLVLHLYSTVLRLYSTGTPLYSACTSLVLRCTPLVLRLYFTVLHSYSVVLHSYSTGTPEYWSLAFSSLEIKQNTRI
jgi:hypothetical protein